MSYYTVRSLKRTNIGLVRAFHIEKRACDKGDAGVEDSIA